jgi:hypothetical protein
MAKLCGISPHNVNVSDFMDIGARELLLIGTYEPGNSIASQQYPPDTRSEDAA